MAQTALTPEERAARWHNPVFRNLMEAAVWVWMCDMASDEEHTVATRYGRLAINPGEILISARDIATDFVMNPRTVQRLLKRMYEEGMIRPVDRGVPPRIGTVVAVDLSYDSSVTFPERKTFRVPTRSSDRRIRGKVLGLTDGKCHYCSCDLTNEPGPNQYHVDHVRPVSRGGLDRVSNYVPACRSCNLSKGSKPVKDWRPGAPSVDRGPT